MTLTPFTSRASAARRRFAAGRAARRGQSVVEFALVLPVLMVLTAVTLDLGRIAFARVTLENAAREGAFQAAKTPSSYTAGQPCPSDGLTNLVICRTQLEAKGSPISISTSDVTLTCDPTDCTPGLGHEATVRVTGRFSLLTPILAVFFGGTDITISSTATAQIETLPPPPAGLPWATPTPSPSASSSASPSPSASVDPGCIIPSAGFTFLTSPNSNKAPVVMFVTDTSTFGTCPIDSWEWAWGDGQISYGGNPISHTYGSAGNYAVTLTVTTVAGRNTTGAVIIRVK
jgi:Flp pilus assembly protein TadG